MFQTRGSISTVSLCVFFTVCTGANIPSPCSHILLLHNPTVLFRNVRGRLNTEKHTYVSRDDQWVTFIHGTSLKGEGNYTLTKTSGVIFNKQGVWMYTGLTWLKKGTVSRYYEHSNEPSSFIQDGEFLVQLSHDRTVKESAPWTWLYTNGSSTPVPQRQNIHSKV